MQPAARAESECVDKHCRGRWVLQTRDEEAASLKLFYLFLTKLNFFKESIFKSEISHNNVYNTKIQNLLL